MTRDEMKNAIDLYGQAMMDVALRQTDSSIARASTLRTRIVNQIDLMYQGAAYDESFNCPPGCSATGKPYCHCQSCGETGVPLNEDGYCHGCSCIELNPDNCSYCGEPLADSNARRHADGDCLEAKILARD
jgi:hypothetical protein